MTILLGTMRHGIEKREFGELWTNIDAMGNDESNDEEQIGDCRMKRECVTILDI